MLYKLERKIEKIAIRDLTIKLLICYVIGYILLYFPGLEQVLGYLTLDPYQIVHGQVWRLITWIVMPPDSSNLFFIIITLVFYYSIGSTMERLWGPARYNLYILSGLILTVVSAFLTMGGGICVPAGAYVGTDRRTQFRRDLTVFFDLLCEHVDPARLCGDVSGQHGAAVLCHPR